MTQTCIDPRVLGDAWVPGQRVVLGTAGIFVVACGDITTEGLRALFDAEPGFQVLGQAATLDRARIEVGRLRPTLLVIDLTGAPEGAAESAWAWQTAYPQMGLLLLAHEPDPALVRAVRDADASGLVLMSSPAETVLAAARAVGAGLTFIDAQLGHALDDLFAARFIFKGKPVDMFAGRDHPSALEAAHSVPTMLKLNGVLYDGVNVATPDVAYDETNNLVILTADRAPLEAAASGSLADGTTITATSATTGYDLFTTTQTADSAEPATPAAATYTMGDNRCFVAATPSPTSTPTGTPNPTSPPPVTANLFDQPRIGCNAFTDATEDAKPSPLGNETDLDVDRVNFKATSEALSVFVHVVSLKAAPALPFDGHRFTVAFTTAGKAIALSAQAAGPATATVGGTANTALKPTAVFDTTKSNVVITVPLAELATVTGAPATGSTVTATTITTAALVKAAGREFAADTATGTADAEKTHTIGDNRCFLPPPGILTLDTDPSGQHSDKTSFVATLTDADELAVEGATITLGFKGTVLRTLVTDEDGVVELAAPITMNAGTATLTASFAGDNAVGPASASQPFTVVLEKSVLTAKGSAGAVTAVLLDDDKTPLAGQTLVFTVGKKVTSVKTDAKGTARLSRLARGTAVTVDYKGISGRYSAAKRVSAKAT